MSEWPFGTGTHYPSIRSWCIRCQESCYDPTTSGFGYDALCLCCREPLYVLRIAELEAEVEATRPIMSNLGELVALLADGTTPLLPRPEWDQDVAFVAFVVDGLRAELAKFKECETQDHIHSTYTGFSVVTRGRKVYHKEWE